MARVAEHVVGRAEELGALDDAVAALDGGEPGALLLVGAPGIGKTRLLAELAARADERGYIVLRGSASELERDLPFWVFVDALDEYVAGLDPRRLASLEPDVGAELARVLPSLSEFARPAEPALQDERYRAHRAVRDLLERLAATKPLVLVLDDVHWADSASVELLGALLRRPPAAAVLLALGARPRQLPDRLARALERAAPLGCAHPSGARGAGARRRPTASGRRGRRRAGREPVRGERRQPVLPRAAGADAPDRAERRGRRAWQESTCRPRWPPRWPRSSSLLSAPARGLLEGAAVAGDPFEPELASAAAAMAEEAATEALDELLATELVRPTGVPRRFRFRHPLVRRAVYDSAPGGWALGAHERCALVLARARRLGGGAGPPRGARRAPRGCGGARGPEPGRPGIGLARTGERGALVRRRAASTARRRAARGASRAAAGARSGAGRVRPDGGEPRDAAREPGARARRSWSQTRVRLTVACAGMEHMLGRLRGRARADHGDARAAPRPRGAAKRWR